jgi:hypothetical protein
MNKSLGTRRNLSRPAKALLHVPVQFEIQESVGAHDPNIRAGLIFEYIGGFQLFCSVLSITIMNF